MFLGNMIEHESLIYQSTHNLKQFYDQSDVLNNTQDLLILAASVCVGYNSVTW